MKFSCPHCHRHIECDEAWGGHQISCPICSQDLVVPLAQATPTTSETTAGPAISEPTAPSKPKLAAGATQVRRPNPGAATTRRTRPARPPGKRNSLVGYALLAVVLVGVGWAGFMFVPGLVSHVKEIVPSNSSTSSSGSGGGSGPLGEVNGAMDISDSLDAGSSASPKSLAATAKSSQTASSHPTNNATKSAH